MFGDQRARLLREDSWEAQGLAEELYAMFSDDEDPVQMGSGVQFAPLPDVPIFDIGDVPDFDAPLFTGTHAGETFTVSYVQAGVAPPGTPGLPGAAGARGASAAMYPGKLVGYLGSNNYTVTIYPQGLSSGSVNVTAKQLQGDPTKPHAVDSTVWAILTKIGSEYFMVVSVWG